mmetsp:Transcript_24405/g.57251  ORF Transcript_24405/g.57251 Transcript_24405/m.57251 type:complete len:130 (-) Transcript_24405:147-536(-)
MTKTISLRCGRVRQLPARPYFASRAGSKTSPPLMVAGLPLNELTPNKTNFKRTLLSCLYHGRHYTKTKCEAVQALVYMWMSQNDIPYFIDDSETILFLLEMPKSVLTAMDKNRCNCLIQCRPLKSNVAH